MMVFSDYVKHYQGLSWPLSLTPEQDSQSASLNLLCQQCSTVLVYIWYDMNMKYVFLFRWWQWWQPNNLIVNVPHEPSSLKASVKAQCCVTFLSCLVPIIPKVKSLRSQLVSQPVNWPQIDVAWGISAMEQRTRRSQPPEGWDPYPWQGWPTLWGEGGGDRCAVNQLFFQGLPFMHSLCYTPVRNSELFLTSGIPGAISLKTLWTPWLFTFVSNLILGLLESSSICLAEWLGPALAQMSHSL